MLWGHFTDGKTEPHRRPDAVLLARNPSEAPPFHVSYTGLNRGPQNGGACECRLVCKGSLDVVKGRIGMSSSWIRVALNPMTRVLVRHRRGATAQVPGDGAGRDRDAWETAAEERTDPCRPPLVSQSPGRPPGARNAAEPTVPLAAGSSALLRSDKKPEFTRSSSGGGQRADQIPPPGVWEEPRRGRHSPASTVPRILSIRPRQRWAPRPAWGL